MICPIHRTPLICPRCAGAKGGKAKVAKGFAVNPVSAAARVRAWKTRKRSGKKIRPRKIGHVCTQFENISEDGMGPFRLRFCKKCGQQWNRIGGEWRKVSNKKENNQ